MLSTAYATGCHYEDVRVSLHELDTTGKPTATPIASTTLLNAQAQYRLEGLSAAGVNLGTENEIRYLLVVSGCADGEFRAPVTDLGDLDVTAGSALVGMLTQGSSDQRDSLKNKSRVDLRTLVNRLSAEITKTATLQSAYSTLTANAELKALFEGAFDHAFTVTELESVQPQILSLTWPTTGLAEDATNSFFVGAGHWNPSYTVRYLWKLDGSVVSTSAAYNYVPGKNAQGTHTLSLYVGADNGSGAIDTSLPYYYEARTITVYNSIPPVAPAVSVAGNAVMVSNPNLTLAIQTGSGRIDCQTFSEFAITADTAVIPGQSAFTYTCDTAGTQNVSFTLPQTNDGFHTIRVWSRDASGAISNTPTLVTFFLDQLPPSVTLSQAPNTVSNVTSPSFVFSGSDPGGGTISGYECRLDSGSYATCSSPSSVSGLGAGSHTYSIRALDSAGNYSTVVTHAWTLDLTAPTIAISSAPNAITNAQSASFQFAGSDTGGGTVASYQCSIDSGAYASCVSPQAYSNLSAGAHSFSVRALDSAGNLSTIATHAWTIDLTGPTAVIGSAPPTTTYSSSASFSFTATDTGGGSVASFECKLDSASYTACTSPASFSGLANGSHQFSVRALDNAGNTGNAVTRAWTIDTSSVLVAIDSAPSAITNQNSVTYTFSAGAGAGAASFECKIDATSFSACTSPKNFSGLSAGSHTFSVRPVDSGGAPGTSVSDSFQIDLSNPTVSIQSSPASLTAATSASFSFDGSDTGGGSIASYQCRIDSGSYSSCSSPRSYASLASGSHTVDIRATDTAGNTGSPASYTWTIDLSGPTLTISSSPSAVTNSSSATFAFTATDSGGGTIDHYECALDGAGSSTCTSPATLSGLAVGAHQMTLFAVDSVGNIGASVTRSWTIDQSNPSVSITAQPAAVTNSSSASFTFSGTDTGGGTVAGYECSLDSAAFSACTSPRALTGLAAGAHNWRVRAIDTAGNVTATPASVSWTIDTTAPTVTIGSTPNSFENNSSATITFTGADTGGGSIANFECKLDSAAFAACTSPYSVSSLSEGAHSVSIRAVDTAGNTGSSSTVSWTSDTIAPGVPSITFQSGGGSTLSGSSLSVTLTVASCTDRQKIFVMEGGGTPTTTDAAWQNCSTTAGAITFSLPTSTQGAHSLKVWAMDQATNISTSSSSLTYTYDTIAPTISSFVVADGTPSVGLPTVSIAVSASDATSAVTQMLVSEDSQATSPWVTYVASGTNFGLTQVPGSKTVYVWVKDAAGNISTASSSNITLDYGSPPSVAITSPISGTSYSPGDTVPIAWTCSTTSSGGLAASPISKIEYTTDDGRTFVSPAIATNLTNNDSSTSGHYNWTMPANLTAFRLLISCKSAAGVVSTAYSPVLGAAWSIFLGDPWYGMTNVNASIANASWSNLSSSIAGDDRNHIYYTKDSAVMKIDSLSGQVTTFMGDVNTAGCGTSATAATGQNLNIPVILGTDTAHEHLFILSNECKKIYKVRTADSTVTLWNTLVNALPYNNGNLILGPNYFVTKNRIFIYFSGATLMRLDLTTANATPEPIIGNGSVSVVTGNYPVGTVVTGAQFPRTSTSFTHWDAFIAANDDASSVWFANGMTTSGYRMDRASDGTYSIGQADIGFNNSPFQNCIANDSDGKIYCAGRDASSQKIVRLFNPSGPTMTSAWTIPTDANDNSGHYRIGAAADRLLLTYSLNAIYSMIPQSPSWSYARIAGQYLGTLGNGQNPGAVALDAPKDIKYVAATQKLWIRNVFGHMRVLDFATSPYTTSTIYSGALVTNVATSHATVFNLAGNRMASVHECARKNYRNFIVSNTTITQPDSFLSGDCNLTNGYAYPATDGAAANGGATSTIFNNVPSFGFMNPVYHTDGKLYFAASNGDNDCFIYSSDRTTLRRIAGKTGACGYVSGDHQGNALGASLRRVYQMQEIASGDYAKDILIWDGDYLRRISVFTESSNPKIYDVYSFTIASTYLTAEKPFIDAYYDSSTEQSGVFGTGKMYWVDTNNRIHKFVPNSNLTSATDTKYNLTGTTFTGYARIALTPAGLLILQPNKSRILRVDP